jgi:hypothetical protein
MTPLVWASLALTVLFFGAWCGIPMWMTFKRPERHPDFAEARSCPPGQGGPGQR